MSKEIRKQIKRDVKAKLRKQVWLILLIALLALLSALRVYSSNANAKVALAIICGLSIFILLYFAIPQLTAEVIVDTLYPKWKE
jgi:uncharacterized membrane protein